MFVALLAALALVPPQTATLTLDSCHALAERNYPMVKQFDLIEKFKEYTISNANKAYLPQVSLTGIGGVVFGGFPGSVDDAPRGTFIGIGQVNQVIWDGGTIGAQKNVITASAEVEKASVAVTMFELRTRVNQVYFGVLLIDEQLALLNERDELLKNNADRIAKMYDGGLTYSTDVDEIAVEQLKVRQQRTEFMYARAGYLDVLSALIGTNLDDNVVLIKPVNVQADSQTASSRPELLLFQQQRALANAQAGMHEANLLPKVGLLGAGIMMLPGASLGPISEDFTALGVVGISASWSIGGLYRNSNENDLHQVALQKIQVQEEMFHYTNNQQTVQAQANINKQRSILAEDDRIVEQYAKVLKGYQAKYDAGACSLFDLLQATERANEARSLQAMHKMQLVASIYEFNTLRGK